MYHGNDRLINLAVGAAGELGELRERAFYSNPQVTFTDMNPDGLPG